MFLDLQLFSSLSFELSVFNSFISTDRRVELHSDKDNFNSGLEGGRSAIDLGVEGVRLVTGMFLEECGGSSFEVSSFLGTKGDWIEGGETKVLSR